MYQIVFVLSSKTYSENFSRATHYNTATKASELQSKRKYVPTQSGSWPAKHCIGNGPCTQRYQISWHKNYRKIIYNNRNKSEINHNGYK